MATAPAAGGGPPRRPEPLLPRLALLDSVTASARVEVLRAALRLAEREARQITAAASTAPAPSGSGAGSQATRGCRAGRQVRERRAQAHAAADPSPAGPPAPAAPPVHVGPPAAAAAAPLAPSGPAASAPVLTAPEQAIGLEELRRRALGGLRRGTLGDLHRQSYLARGILTAAEVAAAGAWGAAVVAPNGRMDLG